MAEELKKVLNNEKGLKEWIRFAFDNADTKKEGALDAK